MAYAYAYDLRPGPVPGVEAPIKIMAYDLLLVASTNTKDDVVYQTVKAMHAGKGKLTAVTPVLRDFDPAKMHANYKGLQYHPGAVKFYREAGVTLTN
jgi:TRAP-type uncharacterized transport system substrate-binding protein